MFSNKASEVTIRRTNAKHIYEEALNTRRTSRYREGASLMLSDHLMLKANFGGLKIEIKITCRAGLIF